VLQPSASGAADRYDQDGLEAELLTALHDAKFGDVIDFGPFEDVCPGAKFCTVPAKQIGFVPNVDLAVIELDDNGHALRAANVLLDRDHPDGVVVPLDRKPGPSGTYGTSSVRWLRWAIDRYNGGTFDQNTGQRLTSKGWTTDPALTSADDIIPGRDDASLQFMAPYPASLFKLVVAFRIMRLVDMGQISLDQVVSWDPTPTTAPVAPGTPSLAPSAADAPAAGSTLAHSGPRSIGPAAAPADDTVSRPVRQWMDAMITTSDNDAAAALLKYLSDRGDLPAMHAELRDLGLGTLQINGINPATGKNWQPGQIHMTSMDTARLLWLIDGGSGKLWTRPDGRPVLASVLSDRSRSYLRALLDQQGYHEALSTTNLCGAANVQAGIPAKMPARWIDLATGTVTVDGYAYGADVRPCNAAAEVIFGHKTGLTFNYGSDAGIVRSLPGKPGRHYVISFISSLGYRYTDPVFASRSTYPCYDEVGPICYVQSIPALGRQIDDYLASGDVRP
jgi:hypothetical protein